MEGPEGIIKAYDLSNKNRVYTTDNVGSCKAAFEERDTNGWFGCFAHIVHLIIKAGLKVPEVSELLNKLHSITKYFHKSIHANLLLKENATWLGFPELGVKSECPTQWNSFLISGKHFLEIKEQITRTLFQ